MTYKLNLMLNKSVIIEEKKEILKMYYQIKLKNASYIDVAFSCFSYAKNVYRIS